MTPGIYKALSSTGYTGKTMKNDKNNLMTNFIKNHLNYTNIGDKPSKRKTFSTKTLPKLVEVIQNRTFNEIIHNSDGSQGQGTEQKFYANQHNRYLH